MSADHPPMVSVHITFCQRNGKRIDARQRGAADGCDDSIGRMLIATIVLHNKSGPPPSLLHAARRLEVDPEDITSFRRMVHRSFLRPPIRARPPRPAARLLLQIGRSLRKAADTLPPPMRPVRGARRPPAVRSDTGSLAVHARPQAA